MFLDRFERARVYLDSGRPREALFVLAKNPKTQIPSIFRVERDYLRGESFRALGFFSAAINNHQKALREKAGLDPVLNIDIFLALAACLRSLGRTDEAAGYCARAMALENGLKLRSKLEWALIERARGKLSLSLRLLRNLKRRYATAGALEELCFVYWALGGVYRLKGAYRLSSGSFLKSLSLAGRLKDSQAQAYARCGLGGTERMRGNLTGAEDNYRNAGILFGKTQDLFGLAYARCGLANALRRRHRYDGALELYRLAYGLYRRLGDRVDLGYVEWGIGETHRQCGRLQEAEKWFQRAWKDFSGFNEARGQVLSQLSLASVGYALGRTAQSERLFKKAYATARRAGLHTHLEVFT
ncbi:MAG: tetratricopeptide repeat protein [Elusimicrobia bacterium]|nr:tetratricopeptide repeat protein [Elusimicrobiota bacterium]